MVKIPDLSKLNLKGIVENVKSIIGQTPIPEAAKNNPTGYHLSELSKAIKTLAELHSKEADTIAKIDATLGNLYQSLTAVTPASDAPTTPAQPKPEVPKTSETEAKK